MHACVRARDKPSRPAVLTKSTSDARDKQQSCRHSRDCDRDQTQAIIPIGRLSRCLIVDRRDAKTLTQLRRRRDRDVTHNFRLSFQRA